MERKAVGRAGTEADGAPTRAGPGPSKERTRNPSPSRTIREEQFGK